jgi:hypothetical protein
MGKGNQYLCDWKKGDIADNLDKLKKIVSNPQYVCMKCARVAKDPDLLHKPEKLDD